MNDHHNNAAPATILSDRTTEILAQAGIKLTTGRTLEIDDRSFVHCHVHHTRMPVIVAAGAMTDPLATRLKFPDLEIRSVVTKRWSLDEDEALALAEVTGANVRPPWWSRRDAYAAIVEDVLRARGLISFFEFVEGYDRLSSIRPRGYSVGMGSDETAFQVEVSTWQREFRCLPTPRKVLLATAIWLYAGDDNSLWLRRLPRRWLAADSIVDLGRDRMLADWGRLVAAYSGW